MVEKQQWATVSIENEFTFSNKYLFRENDCKIINKNR